MLETIITALVTCIAGNLAMLFFFPQERRAKNLANEAKQSEEWRKLYEEAHEELQARDEKIDILYNEISKYRDEIAKQATKITEREIENTRLKLLKCEVPSCPNRKPPTGF